MQQRISLEPAALKVCIDNSTPPFIFQLPPEQGRKILNTAQDSPVFKYPAEITSVTVNTQSWGKVVVHHVKPENIAGTPNVIFYIHGAGWVFGNLHTHVCPLAHARPGRARPRNQP